MIKLLLIIVLSVQVVRLKVAPQTPSTPIQESRSTSSQSLVQASMKFAWNGYKALDIPSGENVFYSPYSVTNALGMLTLGSQGALQSQLKAALRIPGSAASENMLHQRLSDENRKLNGETEATIVVANRFFVNKDYVSKVNPEFKEDLVREYESDLEATPFAENPELARTTINDFVAEKTRGEIVQLLDERPSPRTILMLVNAVYFKGLWTTPFKVHLTRPGPFHRISNGSNDNNVTADFMRILTSLNYVHSSELGVEMVELPYTENEKYAFYAIVPDPAICLNELEASLDDARIVNLLMGKLESRHLDLSIPRFSMKNQFELKSMLERLGVVGMSDPQNSRIFGEPVEGSFVDEIIHEAKIEVNEKGTEASGATSVGVAFVSLPFYKPVTLNRPFLFFIMDRSNGLVLFWGRMEDPSSMQ